MRRKRAILWLAAYAVVAAGSVGGFAYTVAGRDVIAYLVGFVAGSLLVFTGFQFLLELEESTTGSVAATGEAASEAERQNAQAGPRRVAGVTGGHSQPVAATIPTETDGTARESDGGGSVDVSSPHSARFARDRGPRVTARGDQAGDSLASAVGNTAIPVSAGVLAAYLVAHHEPGFPAAAVGAGALTVAIALFFVHGRTYYAGSGALFCLATAAVIWIGVFPGGYGGSPAIVLATLGSFGAIVVLLYLALGRALRRLLARFVGEDVSLHIYDLVTGIPHLLGSLWAYVTIRPHVVRFLAITVGAAAGLVLNYFGIAYPLPWGIAGGIDAVMLTFVGSLLLGFHTLESLHRNLREASGTATVGVGTVTSRVNKASPVASESNSRYDDTD